MFTFTVFGAQVGFAHFEKGGIQLSPLGRVKMELVAAHWSLSPQQGREQVALLSSRW